MEMDHLNQDAPKVIKFTHASEDHKYIVSRTLTEEQGVSHDVFKDQVDAEDDNKSMKSGDDKEIQDDDILKSFSHVYIKEVVRENRMHFQRVPRLGSYMAVPLIYDACLSDVALDAAVEDWNAVAVANDAIGKEKAIYMEEFDNRKQAAISADAVFDEEEREFPEESVKPFICTENKFVVCLDTLGQDREFSDEERRFVLRTVTNFRKTWEAEQRDNLTKDRDEILAVTRPETIGEESQNADTKPDPNVEIERQIEEALAESEDKHIDFEK